MATDLSPHQPSIPDRDDSPHPALEAPVAESSGREGVTLDKVVFGVTAAIALGFVVWGFVDTGSLGAASDSALGWTVTTSAGSSCCSPRRSWSS